LTRADALKLNGKVMPLTGLINQDALVQILHFSVLCEQNEELKSKFF
jgi:hypothetical protein